MSEEKKDYSFEERKIPETDCDHWMGAESRQVLIDLYGTALNEMSDVEADYYLVRYCAEQMTAKLKTSGKACTLSRVFRDHRVRLPDLTDAFLGPVRGSPKIGRPEAWAAILMPVVLFRHR